MTLASVFKGVAESTGDDFQNLYLDDEAAVTRIFSAHAATLRIVETLVEKGVLTMATANQAKDLFVSVTLPVLLAIAAAAWAVYGKLDAKIDNTRIEIKTDVQSYQSEVSQRFDRVDTRLEGVSNGLRDLSNNVVNEISGLRIRQTQFENR
ncbi:hypothetical protein N7325_13445 [Stutzerimonas stutzeri]|uniref:hypothetical protein n=1 Tax=Stutzerimonas stutzeri TaxID=316 RepID=UPI002449752B|nr:hypothetical protein [Stutzerimonas stutzeri]MDH0120817.1 hypothetical protein [Stutzerimonas stutzeri]